MERLGNKWAGNIYGTNTGNFYLTFAGGNDQLKGVARINDPVYGVSVYKVSGSYKEGELKLAGEASPPLRADVVHGDISINGKLHPDGSLRGDWSTSIGTAGTFTAFSHDYEDAAFITDTGKPELPFRALPVSFGTLYFDKEDINHLLKVIKGDFSTNNIIIAITTKEGERTWYFDDFSMDSLDLTLTTGLKIFAQEKQNNKVAKSISVELGFFGVNQLFAQGCDETAILGLIQKISRELKTREVFLATIYKKNGLVINFFIFLYMIAILPTVSSVSHRLVLEGGVVAILFFLTFIHKKVTPLLKIYNKKPGYWRSLWVKFSTIIWSAISGGVGSIAVWLGPHLLTKLFT